MKGMQLGRCHRLLCDPGTTLAASRQCSTKSPLLICHILSVCWRSTALLPSEQLAEVCNTINSLFWLLIGRSMAT